MSLSGVAHTQDDVSINNQKDDREEFYRQLITMRAKREASFINDRGFRHINNRNDKTGVTYAFWIERKK